MVGLGQHLPPAISQQCPHVHGLLHSKGQSLQTIVVCVCGWVGMGEGRGKERGGGRGKRGGGEGGQEGEGEVKRREEGEEERGREEGEGERGSGRRQNM